mgnify:CR=1 FL=1
MVNPFDNISKLANSVGETFKGKTEHTAEVTQEKMMQTLDWAYDKTLTGLPGQKDIHDLVNDYLSKYDKETAIKKLINFQTTKSATSGFVTGFGGVLTMPVTIPANVSSVILFQMRMIAAIALIRGYDLNSDQVQTFVYATLAGTSLTNVMKQTGGGRGWCRWSRSGRRSACSPDADRGSHGRCGTSRGPSCVPWCYLPSKSRGNENYAGSSMTLIFVRF